MPASDHFCGLCGIHLTAGLKRRFQCPADIQSFVTRRCKPTPFLYAHLTNQEQHSVKRQALCIPCVNWKRRVGSGVGLKRTRRPMLQFDQLVIYLLQPGKHQEPDHRCMERLVRAVRQGGANPFACVLPVPVRTIVSRIQGDTYFDCVMAWWEYNGKTEFFASAQEARRVRCAIKLQEEEEEEKE
jgi:hypothetical protein